MCWKIHETKKMWRDQDPFSMMQNFRACNTSVECEIWDSFTELSFFDLVSLLLLIKLIPFHRKTGKTCLSHLPAIKMMS